MYRTTYMLGGFKTQNERFLMLDVILASENLHEVTVAEDEISRLREYAESRLERHDLHAQFSFVVTPESLARHFFEWLRATTTWAVVSVAITDLPLLDERGPSVKAEYSPA